MRHPRVLELAGAAAVMLSLQACDGIFSGMYDEVPAEETKTVAGQLYLDASAWDKWHYLDLKALAETIERESDYNTSDAWVTMDIPTTGTASDNDEAAGIYTYWYDVFGEGISRYEFISFEPTAPQPEPEKWSIAIHRNNIRTNGGSMAATSFRDIDEVPLSAAFMESLAFEEDTWSETDVWVDQGRMLSGIVGNQGISINRAGSAWLRLDIPPMPPAFTLDSSVFILKLRDGTFGALQLVDYQSTAGVKCCLTINYRYPLTIR